MSVWPLKALPGLWTWTFGEHRHRILVRWEDREGEVVAVSTFDGTEWTRGDFTAGDTFEPA
jgi:hypothetical protein